MLQEFLATNRSELMERWRARVSSRHAPDAVIQPDFERVVSDYGDLCQSILALASQQAAAVTAEDLGILNARLDRPEMPNAPHRRGPSAAARAERLDTLAHQLRNLLNTTVVAISAIRAGRVGFDGATAAALDRSLLGMREVIDRVLGESCNDGIPDGTREDIEVSTFVMDVQIDATLAAAGMRSGLLVAPVEAGMLVRADRHALAALLEGLLRRALGESAGNNVMLSAFPRNGRVLMEVGDERWAGADRTEGADRGRESDIAAADGGRLHVRTMPDGACVFTIDLPRTIVPPGAPR